MDAFLEFNEKNILTHAGKVSQKLAQDHVDQEFQKYESHRRQLEASEPVSDFDKLTKKIIGRKPNT